MHLKLEGVSKFGQNAARLKIATVILQRTVIMVDTLSYANETLMEYFVRFLVFSYSLFLPPLLLLLLFDQFHMTELAKLLYAAEI